MVPLISAAAKEAGVPATDKAKLLSEISRYASGKCDQRVVKTWINESAAMHDFMRGILEDQVRLDAAISPPARRQHGPQRTPSTTPITCIP